MLTHFVCVLLGTSASEIAGGGCPTHVGRATDHEGIRVLILRSIRRFPSRIASLRRILFLCLLPRPPCLLHFLLLLN